MPVEIRMPELSSDMTEADLLSWLVKPGDRIEQGDLIAELETEKSTVEFESPASGTLLELVVPEGTNGVQVGTVIALLEEGGDAEAPSSEAASSEAPSPEAPSADAPSGEAPLGEVRAARDPESVPESPPTPMPSPSTAETAATPVAKRIAEQSGVELERITGTGSGGRIVKADVEAASSAPERPASPHQPAAPRATPAAVDSGIPSEIVALSRMRRTIANRLAESKRTIPHFYLSADCEIDRLLALRARFNTEDRRISVNDFVVRAAALALTEVPDANVSYTDEGLVRYQRADISVAVATEGGLITPVVREADRKELVTISEEIRDLATRAREGKLSPREYQGGCFTVSNLGMYGIDSVYPIVNPPQSCILGVGAGAAKPVVRDGELAVGTVMTCTLAADHRAVDGAVGAQLLAAVKRRLEDPLEMLL